MWFYYKIRRKKHNDWTRLDDYDPNPNPFPPKPFPPRNLNSLLFLSRRSSALSLYHSLAMAMVVQSGIGISRVLFLLATGTASPSLSHTIAAFSDFTLLLSGHIGGSILLKDRKLSDFIGVCMSHYYIFNLSHFCNVLIFWVLEYLFLIFPNYC